MPVYKKIVFYKNSRNCSKPDKILLLQGTPILPKPETHPQDYRIRRKFIRY